MKRFENLFLSVHVLWSEKKFLPDYNPKDEQGGNTRFLLAHLSWKKVMWLLCLLLKLIDNFVNKRWGLLGALKRFCSWTLPPLSLFDHCQIILKPIYTSVAKLHMDLHMVSDLVSGNSPMNKVLLGFFRGQDVMLSLSLYIFNLLLPVCSQLHKCNCMYISC